MNKLEMIQKFLDDVNYDGTYFNNVRRVRHTIEQQLGETGDHVTLMIDEALEAAHMHLTCQPGYHEALAKRQQSMSRTNESMAAYYEKHGTRGEY